LGGGAWFPFPAKRLGGPAATGAGEGDGLAAGFDGVGAGAGVEVAGGALGAAGAGDAADVGGVLAGVEAAGAGDAGGEVLDVAGVLGAGEAAREGAGTTGLDTVAVAALVDEGCGFAVAGAVGPVVVAAPGSVQARLRTRWSRVPAA